MEERTTADGVVLAARMLQDYGLKATIPAPVSSQSVSHWVTHLAWPPEPGEQQEANRGRNQFRSLSEVTEPIVADTKRASVWWEKGLAAGAANDATTQPLMLRSPISRSDDAHPGRIGRTITVEPPSPEMASRILTVGIRPATYGTSGYASVVQVAIIVPEGMSAKDFQQGGKK
jgi:hypothetical protein